MSGWSIFPSGSGGAPSSATANLFIFRPGEPSPSGNVYASWPALVAAAAAAKGTKGVYFDDSLAPCVIPAGAWVFNGCTGFFGCSLSGATPLAIADGATLSPDVCRFIDLAIDSQTTTFVIDAPTVPLSIYTYERTTTVSQTGAGGTFIRINTPGGSISALFEEAQFLTSVGPVVSATVAGAFALIAALDASIVNMDTIAAIVGASAGGSIVDPSAFIDPSQAGVLPGGVLSISLAAQAVRVNYDDFVVAPPLGAADVQAAIDALKNQPLQSWKFSGTLVGSGVVPVFGYNADVPNASFQSPLQYPRNSPSGNVTLSLYVSANTFPGANNTTFEVYLNNAPTGIIITVAGGALGYFTISSPLAIVIGDQIDLRADHLALDALLAISYSATLDFLP